MRHVDPAKYLACSDEPKKVFGKLGALDGDFYDIDNDGDPDLIVGKLDGLTIGINDGTGNFKETTSTFITPLTVTIVDIEIADFNGDSKPDIFVACFRGPDKLLLSQSE